MKEVFCSNYNDFSVKQPIRIGGFSTGLPNFKLQWNPAGISITRYSQIVSFLAIPEARKHIY
jgi:hypothetical protein